MQAPKLKESQVFGYVLGTVVERLRRQRGWTQGDLAARVGVSQPVISRIEAGKAQPDAYVYGRLAAAFGLTVQQLEAYAKEAVSATKRAAEAVSERKPWDDVVGVVGTIGLIGLIGFAVAAMLGGDDDPKKPPSD